MVVHPHITHTELPNGSWDTHCHTFDPTNHPFELDSPYIPPPASVDQLINAVPTENFCIVMAMPEGVRPTLALESVTKISAMPGRTARATVVLDFDKTTDEELGQLSRAGVRSVRIHTKGAITKHLSGASPLQLYIEAVARRIAPLGWSLDGQLKTQQWVELAPVIRNLHKELGIIFVADHCFYLRPEDVGTEAFHICVRLVDTGAVYVKISGLDRMVERGAVNRMEPVVRALTWAHGGKRSLFGSDWPHVIPGNMKEELLQIDSTIELAYLRRWLSKEAFENLMVNNPSRLYM